MKEGPPSCNHQLQPPQPRIKQPFTDWELRVWVAVGFGKFLIALGNMVPRAQMGAVLNRDRGHYRKQKPDGQVQGAEKRVWGVVGFLFSWEGKVMGDKVAKLHTIKWKWYMNMKAKDFF